MFPGVSEDMLAVLSGGALYYFGDRIHPIVKKYGTGVLIAGIGSFIKGLVPGASPLYPIGKGKSPSPQVPKTLGDLAKAESRKVTGIRRRW